MVEILTEVESKRKLEVGNGWIYFLLEVQVTCDHCGKLLNKKEPYLEDEIMDPICEKCFNKDCLNKLKN